MVRAPPPLSTHAMHTMPHSSSATPAIHKANADEPLNERKVSDKAMATNHVRKVELRNARLQGATSKIGTKPNKPNTIPVECSRVL